MSFNLRGAGEAIGLYAADGTAIDAVVLGAQTNNISQGRSPDGSGTILYLPTSSPHGSNGGPQPPSVPQLSQVVFAGGKEVQFTISTVGGRSYQVEYKD